MRKVKGLDIHSSDEGQVVWIAGQDYSPDEAREVVSRIGAALEETD